jgi:S1-C subfamily serine protease
MIGGGLLLVVIVGVVAFLAGRSDPGTPAQEDQRVAENSDPLSETASLTQTVPETPSAPPAENVPIPPAGDAVANTTSATELLKNEKIKPTFSPPAKPPAIIPEDPVAAVPVTMNPETITPLPDSPETQAPESKRPVLSVADLNELVEPSVVRIDVISREGSGNGSGYVVDASGLIATNYHVVEGGTRATVVFADGTSTPVVGLVALLPRKDIAIVKIDLPSRQLKPIPLAPILPRKGEATIAFGAPLGLSFSMSEGIVSSIRTSKELKDLKVVDVEGTWLQTTTPISPGNSGGPLINQRGELVGMNTMTLNVGQNLNFAISALDIAEALKGKLDRVMAFSPENTPPVSKSVGQGRERLIDATNTPKGQELLAQLKQIVLLRIEIGFNDVTGNVAEFLKVQAEKALKQANIELVKKPDDVQDPALMIVALNFEDKDGANTAVGTQELELMILLIWQGTDENGQARVYKLYEAKEKVGTFAQASLFRGIIPRRVQDGVAEVYRKYAGTFRKAQRESGK